MRENGRVRAMRTGGRLVVAATLLAACRGGDGDVPRSAAQGGSARPAAADEPASPGRGLYRRACVMCHGERGAGTPIGPALNDRRRELAQVVRVVEAGAPAADTASYTPMPPRGDGTFTDQDVRNVAEYVQSLAR
jgi:mono/diheme cytochrome c family protein